MTFKTRLQLLSLLSFCTIASAQAQIKQDTVIITKKQNTQSYQNYENHFTRIAVPDHLSVEDFINELKESGKYDFVEMDYETNQDSWSSSFTPPNDFIRSQQTHLRENSEQIPTASGAVNLWSKIRNYTKRTPLYIMDSGFFQHEDVEFSKGFNFFTRNNVPISEIYLESEYNLNCESTHGTSVASVAAAKFNNNFGGVGVADHVDVIPIRVSDCGSGRLSDIALALNWLARKELYPELNFTPEPGVVNISIGATTEHCPNYLQTAINHATEAGFTIVVSAGNGNIDASARSFSNCENVISVGAANVGNVPNPADKAPFSNFGDRVDVMTQGQHILSATKDRDFTYRHGTSFSAPIVAGALSMISKDIQLSHSQWVDVLNRSSIPRWEEKARCWELGCGKGTLDVSLAYDNADKLIKNQEATYVSTPFHNVSNCTRDFALTHLVNQERLCQRRLFSLTIDSLPPHYFVEVSNELGESILFDNTAHALKTKNYELPFSGDRFFYSICNSKAGAQCTPKKEITVIDRDNIDICKEKGFIY